MLAAGAVGMNYLAARAHDRADERFNALEPRCFDDHSLCGVDDCGPIRQRRQRAMSISSPCATTGRRGAGSSAARRPWLGPRHVRAGSSPARARSRTTSRSSRKSGACARPPASASASSSDGLWPSPSSHPKQLHRPRIPRHRPLAQPAILGALQRGIGADQVDRELARPAQQIGVRGEPRVPQLDPPLCRAPIRSPIPRSARSSSAILNPSCVAANAVQPLSVSGPRR